MKRALTVKRLNAIKRPTNPTGEIVWDTNLHGFGVRLYPTGKKVALIQYGPRGKQKRLRLGAIPPLTLDDAFKLAKVKLAEYAKGRDPQRDAKTRREMPTFRLWAKEYLGALEGKRKSLATMKSYLNEAGARWGATALDQITARDVEVGFRAAAQRGKPTANRWLATVRAAFHAAMDKGWITTNPCAPVRPFNESDRARTRTLAAAELASIVKAVEALENAWHRALFMGLLETGCRLSELLHAKWVDLDGEAGLLILRSPKAGRLQTVPLQPVTLSRFQELDELNEYIFPGSRTGTHMNRVTARLLWHDVCAAAGVTGATLHDVRRTVGLYIAREAGIAVAAKVLRHSRVDVTARVYSPFNVGELRKAAENALVKQGKLLHLRPKGKVRATQQAS